MMSEAYYLVKEQALSGVLKRVVEAKKLLRSGKAKTVQEAADQLGISRSAFYKYKDMIEPFAEPSHATSFVAGLVLFDEPGVLSSVVDTISQARMNIQTIYQTMPAGGLAEISVRVQCPEGGADIETLMKTISAMKGVASAKLLARETR